MPQCHRKLAGQGDNRPCPRAPATGARAIPVPPGECAARLVKQPAPGHLDQMLARHRIAGLADRCRRSPRAPEQGAPCSLVPCGCGYPGRRAWRPEAARRCCLCRAARPAPPRNERASGPRSRGVVLGDSSRSAWILRLPSPQGIKGGPRRRRHGPRPRPDRLQFADHDVQAINEARISARISGGSGMPHPVFNLKFQRKSSGLSAATVCFPLQNLRSERLRNCIMQARLS